MKKIFLASLILLILVWCQLAFAADSCVQTLTGIRDSQTQIVLKYELAFVCTASSGAFTATPISAANLVKLGGFFLYRAETKPSATAAPQDQYDITIVNANGVDVVGGLLANRSRTAVQDVLLAPSTGFYQIGSSTLTVTPTGNNVASAAFTLVLEFTR